MNKNLKKTRDYMFKRCNDLLSATMSYLNQMQNAIDVNYDEKEERKRFELFQRCAEIYNWLNYAYIHDNDMAQEFELCAAIYREVYTMFYNFKF